MKIRPDLPDQNSPPQIEVVQLRDVPGQSSTHIYTHAEVFTPDSRRFIFRGSEPGDGPSGSRSRHRYYLCDIENNCELFPLPLEISSKGACVSPDGRYVYYFVCEPQDDRGSVFLKRTNLEGGEPTTIAGIDGPLADSKVRVARTLSYPTISSDGRRLAMGVEMNDKSSGVVVFDLATGSAEMILQGTGWSNAHLQYCRSPDSEEAHDLLVQELHALEVAQPPGTHRLQDVDVHVVRDDGTNFRTLPWGRDGREYCMGHQCWRGRTNWAITSTITHLPTPDNSGRTECQLIESRPVPDAGHIGRNHDRARRNDLTRDFANPQFYHFATDIGGNRLISDYWHPDGHQRHPQGRQLLYLAHLSTLGRAPAEKFTYLLDTAAAPERTTHAHPFLSPDGKYAFFNSDESGVCQAYMIRNLPNL